MPPEAFPVLVIVIIAIYVFLVVVLKENGYQEESLVWPIMLFTVWPIRLFKKVCRLIVHEIHK